MSTIQFHSLVNFLPPKAGFHKIWIFPCCSGKTLCLDLVWLLRSFPCSRPHLFWGLHVKLWWQKYILRLQWWSWLRSVGCLSCLACSNDRTSSIFSHSQFLTYWPVVLRKQDPQGKPGSFFWPVSPPAPAMVWAYMGRLKNLCAGLTCSLKSLAMCSYAVAQYAPSQR